MVAPLAVITADVIAAQLLIDGLSTDYRESSAISSASFDGHNAAITFHGGNTVYHYPCSVFEWVAFMSEVSAGAGFHEVFGNK